MATRATTKGLDPTIQFVLNRLVTDAKFRKRFETNREEALKPLDLTPSQRSALKRIDVRKLNNAVTNIKDIAAAAIGSIYL